MKTNTVKGVQRQHRHLNVAKTLLALTSATTLTLGSSQVFARGEVTTLETQETPGSLRTYYLDGQEYRWGAGRNLLIAGFQYGGRDYDYRQVANRVVIRRVDNDQASGLRCSVFVENTGDALSYGPSYPDDGTESGNCDLARIISGRTLNTGALDLFSNIGSGDSARSSKNIERVDYIADAGIEAGSTDEALLDSGHVVIEKSGNNRVQLAAILSLDADGNPSSYGPPVIVYENYYTDSSQVRYGLTNVTLSLDFLSNENDAAPGWLRYITSQRETLGMAFVSKADLGITKNQVYYGFSMFAPDVDPTVHDLTNPSSFPLNTYAQNLGPGDADLFAGTALPSDPLNEAPIAVDDEAETPLNTAVTVDVLANDLDPDGGELTISLETTPDNGSVSVQDGKIVYTPVNGFDGNDSFTYRITDPDDAFDVATVRVVVSDDNHAPVATDDLYETASGQSVCLYPLANDTDPDGDALTYSLISYPTSGTVEETSECLLYTPNPGASGLDQFTYQASDGSKTDFANVQVSVGAVLGDNSGVIETGLKGHGAGSLNGFLLLVLGLLRAVTLRRQD